MRVPNRGWDETPRRGGSASSQKEGQRRSWDETPRGKRDGSPGMQMNGKEWEEEQVRLDRDWYLHDD